jgi:GINS complex protein
MSHVVTCGCFCCYQQVELPLWLARALATRRAVQVQQPQHYGEHFREQLHAGPGAIDLREASPYYYQVGGIVARMMGDSQLENLLLDVFCGERFKKLLDCSLNSANNDIAAYTRTLPASERKLFDAGYDTNDEYIKWKSRENMLLKASRLANDAAHDAKRARHV